MDHEALRRQIDEFVEAGNYHAAYNITLSALNECRRENDQGGVDACIDLIRGIVDRLADEFGSGRSTGGD